MTTKPRLKRDLPLTPLLVALALFVVMALTFVGASFGAPAGFPSDASVTASLGYAMFDITGDFVPIEGEGMLAAFEIIDVVLVAALVAAVMLARRETGGAGFRELLSDGGRALREMRSDERGGED